MNKHLTYLSYLLRHKWHVFWACIDLGVPLWAAIVHDWSKFTPLEWAAYVDYFYGGHAPDKTPARVKERFQRAWKHHIRHNPHHWDHWVIEPGDSCIDMPLRFRREMIADWIGAGRAQHGHNDVANWYKANKDKIKLHPDTRQWVEAYLGEIG